MANGGLMACLLSKRLLGGLGIVSQVVALLCSICVPLFSCGPLPVVFVFCSSD